MKTFKEYLNESKENPPEGYAHHLKDAHDIADHIKSTSTSHVDHEYMTDYFRGTHAKLKKTSLSDIRPSNSDNNIPNEKKQKRYSKMSSHTRPPIVVEKGEIQDGHHRYRDALNKGETHIWAYHVTEKDR